MTTVPLTDSHPFLHIVDHAGHSESRVITQTIMIIEILPPQGQSDDALRHRGRHIVPGASGITTIGKGAGNASCGIEETVGLPQQQRDAVRRHAAAVERGLQTPVVVLYSVSPWGWAPRHMQVTGIIHIDHRTHPPPP